MCGFSKKKKKPAYGIEPVLVPSGAKLPSFVHLPIVGEIAVGKTSLLHRFVGQQFPTRHHADDCDYQSIALGYDDISA